MSTVIFIVSILIGYWTLGGDIPESVWQVGVDSERAIPVKMAVVTKEVVTEEALEIQKVKYILEKQEVYDFEEACSESGATPDVLGCLSEIHDANEVAIELLIKDEQQQLTKLIEDGMRTWGKPFGSMNTALESYKEKHDEYYDMFCEMDAFGASNNVVIYKMLVCKIEADMRLLESLEGNLETVQSYKK